jgi:predicted phage terminase large subunit-like protein
LIDQERGRWDFPQTIAAVERMTHKWPKASLKLVEDKANGSAVIQTLRNRIQGLVGVEPQGGKIARAQAVTAQIESGNVFLPHPQIASWHDAFVEECATFPFGRNDDQVDQMTQALIRMRTMPQYSATSIYQPPGGSRAWMNV